MRPLAAFDATGIGVVTAARDSAGVIASCGTPGPRGQVEQLAPELAAVVAELELEWREIRRIGVVRGPGSFVGVRVGVAAARALALATGAEVVALDGFEIAAETARLGGLIERDAAVVFGVGDRLIWRRFDFSGARVVGLSDPVQGGRDALEALSVSVTGPGASTDWPGADARALIGLTETGAPTADPVTPFYARPPDAAPPSRTPLSVIARP